MKMKMIVTALVAAVSMFASARLDMRDCGTTQTVEIANCPVMAFKFTANGKTTYDTGSYKTVKTLKVTKGILALVPQDSTTEITTNDVGEVVTNTVENADGCCYPTAILYAKVKIGNVTRNVVLKDIDVTKWSLFGKNVDDVRDYLSTMKKGSSRTLESDFAFTGEDVEVISDDEDEDGSESVSLWASGFGKFKATNCKAKKQSGAYCSPAPAAGECVLDLEPKTYSGHFTGLRDCLPETQLCLNCECSEHEVMNGTWKATYLSKITTLKAAQKEVFGKVIDEE